MLPSPIIMFLKPFYVFADAFGLASFCSCVQSVPSIQSRFIRRI